MWNLAPKKEAMVCVCALKKGNSRRQTHGFNDSNVNYDPHSFNMYHSQETVKEPRLTQKQVQQVSIGWLNLTSLNI